VPQSADLSQGLNTLLDHLQDVIAANHFIIFPIRMAWKAARRHRKMSNDFTISPVLLIVRGRGLG
jgi:phosphotransferase system  glucose/maltose/N-acetylglucosamine-specific IIC component